MVTPASADRSVEEFKARTREKLRGITCPVHRQAPRLKFEGQTLKDIRVSMSACCDRLMRIANKAIAS